MNDTFDRLALTRVATCGPSASALGLMFAGGASLGMWFGLAQAVRWAAHSIF